MWEKNQWVLDWTKSNTQVCLVILTFSDIQFNEDINKLCIFGQKVPKNNDCSNFAISYYKWAVVGLAK